MSRFQRRYSDAQDRAIIAAQIEYGMSPRAAAEAAALGELPGGGGLAPFEIPMATARHKAGEVRRHRKAAEVIDAGPSVALDALVGEVLAGLDREAQRARAAQARGDDCTARYARLARAGKDAAALVRASRQTPTGKPTPAEVEREEQADGFLAGLADKV